MVNQEAQVNPALLDNQETQVIQETMETLV